jgi:hypothetical protein
MHSGPSRHSPEALHRDQISSPPCGSVLAIPNSPSPSIKKKNSLTLAQNDTLQLKSNPLEKTDGPTPTACGK